MAVAIFFVAILWQFYGKNNRFYCNFYGKNNRFFCNFMAKAINFIAISGQFQGEKIGSVEIAWR